MLIRLSDAQVAQVVREASGGASLVGLLAEGGNAQRLEKTAASLTGDWAYSRALARALLVLAAFPADGSDREMTEVARQLALPPSTTYRYIRTWTAFGFLEQLAHSRRYRRPTVPPRSGAEDRPTPRR